MPLFGDFEIPKDNEKYDDGAVGQIRIGGSTNGVAYTTDTIRITADDPKTLEPIAKKFGGEIAEYETTKSDRYELLTDHASLLLDLQQWEASFNRWHENKLVRSCDGKTQRDGNPCECPASDKEKKELSKQGLACKPAFRAMLTFSEFPELGRFRFKSGAWSILPKSNDLEALVADGPAAVELAVASFNNKKGQLVRYPKVSIPA